MGSVPSSTATSPRPSPLSSSFSPTTTTGVVTTGPWGDPAGCRGETSTPPCRSATQVVGYGKAVKKQVMEMTRIVLRLERSEPDDAADALTIPMSGEHSACSYMGRSPLAKAIARSDARKASRMGVDKSWNREDKRLCTIHSEEHSLQPDGRCSGGMRRCRDTCVRCSPDLLPASGAGEGGVSLAHLELGNLHGGCYGFSTQTERAGCSAQVSGGSQGGQWPSSRR